MTVPPEAIITAAVEAVLAKRGLISDPSRDWARPVVRDALEAAAPLIAAAERDRIIKLAESTRAVCTADEGTQHYFADLLRGDRP